MSSIKSDTMFSVADYVIFIGTVIFSFGIGVFFAVRDRVRSRNTPEDYFLADRKSKLIPVTLSFIVTFQSSLMILGTPAEVYLYGGVYAYYTIVVALSFIITGIFIVPVFYPLKLTTVHEYLYLRYGDNVLRYLTVAMGMFYSLVYMATVTYGTCVALDVVMGLPYWATIIIYTLITTVYTSIGGIKAVIWTDVFQFVIMSVGIIAIFIKVTVDLGGLEKIRHFGDSRFNFNAFSVDPRVRYTFWNLGFTSLPMWLYVSYMQPAMQRVYSTPNLRTARNMYFLATPVYCIVLVAVAFEGVTIYAYYMSKQCDIYEAGILTNINQLVPFTIIELFRDLLQYLVLPDFSSRLYHAPC